MADDHDTKSASASPVLPNAYERKALVLVERTGPSDDDPSMHTVHASADPWDGLGVSAELRMKLEDADRELGLIERVKSIVSMVTIGDGFVWAENEAMARAGTNKPTGTKYGKHWAEVVALCPRLAAMRGKKKQPTRSKYVWLSRTWHQDDECRRWWHEDLNDDERSRLTHPGSIRRAYDRAHLSPDATPRAFASQAGPS